MTRHLKSWEFTDVLEGNAIDTRTVAHLDACTSCQAQLRELAPYFEAISHADAESATELLNSDNLRRAVREQLLAHSVRKSFAVSRWTGYAISPAAAWSLAIALLVTVGGLGGFWHYQSSHSTSATNVAVDTAPVALFMDDSVSLESEALAWSEGELFVALNELEASEAEILRDLIADVFGEDNGI